MSKQLTRELALRYNRQMLLPQIDLEGQESLLNSHVLIAGLGGLGCSAAQFIVASGIGKVTLVDHDMVELSNLQRQVLHTEADIGLAKVTSAQKRLIALNSDCHINAIHTDINQQNIAELLKDIQLILDCTDNLSTRNLLNQHCVEHEIPLVSGAAVQFEGQVTSIIPGNSNPCYQCMSQFFGEPALSCIEAGVVSPLVGVIGTMQALETVKILSKAGTPIMGRLMLFDALRGEWQQFSVKRNPSCPVCKNR
ncbi:HesA/MoeB/ThiF family protein [Neptunicella marina]|uniref:Molybdopterin-synthase adenylyltransferase MoeB n=1 Tax=Neptunicella marina TaxID=2125989 RepID=A0A8J6M3S6_9ALTE|nr:molybdopterin-synthase adenylyltransferase MoeB [Neptunicella marina]MBC3767392.1 molybdopterin-synthase adenylyltransferase MoeB [Neptunicella marina]